VDRRGAGLVLNPKTMPRIRLRPLVWTPLRVSWLSFVLMGLVVAAIGLTGTAHVVDYLRGRLTAHGIEHNREVATRLHALLQQELPAEALAPAALQRIVEKYAAFGYRIFILDLSRQRLVADSGGTAGLPRPIRSSWLTSAVPMQDRGETERPQAGASTAVDAAGRPLLVWLGPLTVRGAPDGHWRLGVASDRKTLASFLGDLHWHLDGVLLLTYLLIGVLGHFSVRGIGRAYERRLESLVRERTRALESAHAQMLAKARLATIGQTASVLTHEIRNPLASIKLALSSVRAAAGLAGRERRRIELVLGEVDRLDGLLSATLDYVRPIRLSTRPVPLDALLTQVLHRQAPLLSERRVSIRRRPCPECPALRLDEDQLHQVLLNLLKNALEASPPGGEIGIRLTREGDELVLEIANGGEPMGAETRARAFEPFFTTKPKGSGLGLGLVQRVIEEHGGRVALASDAVAGTRVTLRLPLTDP